MPASRRRAVPAGGGGSLGPRIVSALTAVTAVCALLVSWLFETSVPDDENIPTVTMHRPGSVVPHPGYWELSCHKRQRYLPTKDSNRFPACGHPFNAGHHWNPVS